MEPEDHQSQRRRARERRSKWRRVKRRWRRRLRRVGGWPAVVLVVVALISVPVAAAALMSDSREAGPGMVAMPTPAPTPPPETAAPVTIHRVTFLGDSYTEGAGASGPALVYAYATAHDRGWKITNLGKGGTGYVNTGSGAGAFLSRLPAVVKSKPDLVVVQGGLNDYDYPTATVASAADELYAAIESALPGVPIVVVGPFDPEKSPAARAENLALRKVARAHGVMYASTLDWLEPDMIGPDGRHPNDAGHTAIMERLSKFLDVRGLV